MAVEVAEYYRELKEIGLMPSLEDMSVYEFEVYKSAERASRKVQNDLQLKMQEESENGGKKKLIGQGIGDKSAIDW